MSENNIEPLALQDLPLKNFNDVCVHSLSQIDTNCEYLDFHAQQRGDEEALDVVEDIRASCAWLERSHRSMMELLDCMQGSASPTCRAIDIFTLLKRIEAQKEPIKKQLGIKLSIKPGTDSSPCATYADADWAELILLHLVSNALRACECGGRITLGLERRENSALVYVEDNGCGLPGETAESQLNNCRHFTGGAQCGLLLCKEYCRLMSWSLRLLPLASGGTRAEVMIPLNPRLWMELHSDDEYEERIAELRMQRFLFGEMKVIKKV